MEGRQNFRLRAATVLLGLMEVTMLTPDGLFERRLNPYVFRKAISSSIYKLRREGRVIGRSEVEWRRGKTPRVQAESNLC